MVVGKELFEEVIFDQRPEHHDSIKTGKSEEAKVYSLVH